MNEKYEAPTLTHVGTVESLTAGLKSPASNLDATFPDHTPVRKLTYS